MYNYIYKFNIYIKYTIMERLTFLRNYNTEQ